MRGRVSGWAMAATAAFWGCAGLSQALPATKGETLSGRQLAPAEAVRGHAAVLVASFSKDAGPAADDWMRALRVDLALAAAPAYELVMLEQAPGFVRGLIKGSMRKGLTPAQQDSSIILTQDEKLWRSYFQVTSEKEPYIVLLDAAGHVLWHGHGAARDLEPLLKAALR